MPIYEYQRPDGTTFELLQKFSDDPLTHDPDTGAPVTRVLHAPAIHFKGPGFYANDVGTVKGNRELERAAEAGADAHDEKMRNQRKDREQAAAAKAKAPPRRPRPAP